jgi:hypothetical protein
MDGWVTGGGSVTVCAGFIPKAPPSLRRNSPSTPRGYRGQIPITTRSVTSAVDPFTEQTQEAVPVLDVFHKALRACAELSPYPPPNPTKGYLGQIPITTKTGTYGRYSYRSAL